MFNMTDARGFNSDVDPAARLGSVDMFALCCDGNQVKVPRISEFPLAEWESVSLGLTDACGERPNKLAS